MTDREKYAREKKRNARGISSIEWPLGEGAAKLGIEMARRDITQHKRESEICLLLFNFPASFRPKWRNLCCIPKWTMRIYPFEMSHSVWGVSL